MPLNIDWQQILLHLFNFAILAFGLYILLYKPVKDFMEKRSAYYRDMDDAANKKLESAKALEADYHERMEKAEAEITARKAQAAEKAEAEAEEEIKNAKAQAAKIMSDARAGATTERERIVSSAGREIAELAAAAADKLLKEALKNEK